MKALLLSEGGREQGYGHLTRCKTLHDALRAAGFDVRMSLRGEGDVAWLLGGVKYVREDWLSAPQSKCDVVVLDSYSYGDNDAARLSGLGRVAVYFDDVNRMPYPPGVVVNGTLTAEKMAYPERPGVTYLLGPGYQLVRPEFFGHGIPEKPLTPKSLVVTFGGGDVADVIGAVMEVVEKYCPALDVFILGSEPRPQVPLREAGRGFRRYLYMPDVREWAALVRGADFAVCAGGQFLFELAAASTPAVVIGIAGNQQENIRGWQNAGFIEVAGWREAEDIKARLAGAIKSVMAPGRLAEMRRRAAGIINPGAAMEIVRVINSSLRHTA